VAPKGQALVVVDVPQVVVSVPVPLQVPPMKFDSPVASDVGASTALPSEALAASAPLSSVELEDDESLSFSFVVVDPPEPGAGELEQPAIPSSARNASFFIGFLFAMGGRRQRPSCL
jgi:hypothetical protein